MKLAIALGLLVILAGASIILNAFHIHFPFFRVCLGLAFGWVGVSLVLSALGFEQRWMAFRPHRMDVGVSVAHTPRGEEQNVVFSSGDVDVSRLHPGERAKLNVIFGNAVVHYDPALPLEIHASTAFGSTAFSDGADVAFGDRTFCTPACAHAPARARLDVATVFGTTELSPMPVPAS